MGAVHACSVQLCIFGKICREMYLGKQCHGITIGSLLLRTFIDYEWTESRRCILSVDPLSSFSVSYSVGLHSRSTEARGLCISQGFVGYYIYIQIHARWLSRSGFSYLKYIFLPYEVICLHIKLTTGALILNFHRLWFRLTFNRFIINVWIDALKCNKRAV